MRMQTTTRQALCVALASGNLSACSEGAAAADVSEIEQRRPFNPTEAELASEPGAYLHRRRADRRHRAARAERGMRSGRAHDVDSYEEHR